MGLKEHLKTGADHLKGRAGDFAQQHHDKIESGLEKAAKTVDDKTKGKYSSRIRSGTGKAKHALERLSEQAEHSHGPGPAKRTQWPDSGPS
ncbi:antitoxin [Streptomyces sp. NPDC017993]|uniref:antitoxin n=1 Tax=Streptomyces sp. NPDC017993 TaxID=3365027 RepID=UPI0037994D50